MTAPLTDADLADLREWAATNAADGLEPTVSTAEATLRLLDSHATLRAALQSAECDLAEHRAALAETRGKLERSEEAGADLFCAGHEMEKRAVAAESRADAAETALRQAQADLEASQAEIDAASQAFARVARQRDDASEEARALAEQVRQAQAERDAAVAREARLVGAIVAFRDAEHDDRNDETDALFGLVADAAPSLATTDTEESDRG